MFCWQIVFRYRQMIQLLLIINRVQLLRIKLVMIRILVWVELHVLELVFNLFLLLVLFLHSYITWSSVLLFEIFGNFFVESVGFPIVKPFLWNNMILLLRFLCHDWTPCHDLHKLLGFLLPFFNTLLLICSFSFRYLLITLLLFSCAILLIMCLLCQELAWNLF